MTEGETTAEETKLADGSPSGLRRTLPGLMACSLQGAAGAAPREADPQPREAQVSDQLVALPSTYL